MTPLTSPFRTAPGAAPEYLGGRDEILDLIGDRIAKTLAAQPAVPTILIGERGMGKTSLLLEAERLVGNDGIVLHGSGTAHRTLAESMQADLQKRADAARPIFGKLRDGVDSLITAIPSVSYDLPHDGGELSLKANWHPQTAKPFFTALAELNTAARREGRFLAIVIDQMEQVDSPELSAFLETVNRSAGTEKPVLFIGAGTPAVLPRMLENVPSSERYAIEQIGLLLPSQGRRILESTFALANITSDRDATSEVVRAAKGYPYFLQAYGDAAFEAFASDGHVVSGDRLAIALSNVTTRIDREFYGARFRTAEPNDVAYMLTMTKLGARQTRAGGGGFSHEEIANELGVDPKAATSTRNRLLSHELIHAPIAGLMELRMPLTEDYIARNRVSLEHRAAHALFERDIAHSLGR